MEVERVIVTRQTYGVLEKDGIHHAADTLPYEWTRIFAEGYDRENPVLSRGEWTSSTPLSESIS